LGAPTRTDRPKIKNPTCTPRSKYRPGILTKSKSYKSMKFRFTLPTNEAFFQRYAGLVPTLSKLGYLAQIVSALTEIGILYALIRNAIADVAPPIIATIGGMAGALLATAFIEVGLRKFLPFAARQILNKRFAGLDLVMSIAIFAASLLLLTASGALSFYGSKETVATVVPPAKTEGTGAIDTTVNSHRESNRRAYQRDSSAIATRYASQIAALELAYKAGTDAANVKLQSITAKERNTGQSFATNKATIKQAIADATAAHALKLAELTSAGAMEMQALQDEHNALNADLMRERSEWLTALKQGNEAAEMKRQKQVSSMGGSMWLGLRFCALLVLLVINRTGKKYTNTGPGCKRRRYQMNIISGSHRLAAFMAAISERYHANVFALIKRIEDGTPEPPEPGKAPTVYEYEQRMERRQIGFKTRHKRKTAKRCVITQPLITHQQPTQATPWNHAAKTVRPMWCDVYPKGSNGKSSAVLPAKKPTTPQSMEGANLTHH
jgi:hypothetical protein